MKLLAPSLFVITALLYGIYVYLSALTTNIAKAKKRGFRYVVLHMDANHSPLAPRLVGEMASHYGDAFVTVSPRSITLQAANAEIIRDVVLQRERFPKNTDAYEILRQFGENIITVEGHPWRRHCKVTSASFNERNAALVFREAIRQTRGMLQIWAAAPDSSPASREQPLRTLEQDTMLLTLHIIAYAGFGVRLLWPGQKLPSPSDPILAKYASLEPPAGHHISFVQSLKVLFDNILLLLLLPKWLLKLLPFQKVRATKVAYQDYIKYMDELLEDKSRGARDGDHAHEGMDLMGQLVRTMREEPATTSADAHADEGGNMEKKVKNTVEGGRMGGGKDGEGRGEKVERARLPVLSREILGNAFIMFIAGHETANVLHFTLIEMAAHPEAQRALQRDRDGLLGDSDPASWDFDELVNPMTANMVGACMQETLRLFPPTPDLLKVANEGQPLTMDGRTFSLPKGANVSMLVGAVHQNPRYWPHEPSRLRPGRDDLADYKPARWFQHQTPAPVAPGAAATATAQRADDEDIGSCGGGLDAKPKAQQLFRPERGAYLPFNDGARSCVGRCIALAEILAALAVIFRDYSLELAVDAWASAGEVERMDRAARRATYRRAQERSRRTMGSLTNIITLKLHGASHVPVRLVRRGTEQFVDWIEDEGSTAAAAAACEEGNGGRMEKRFVRDMRLTTEEGRVRSAMKAWTTSGSRTAAALVTQD